MRRLRNDDGATAVMVAILMVVLVGMAAFAVDMGSMHLQNRELQNSADAGALAIAQQCAAGSCPDDEDAEALFYAGANSTSGGGFFENTAADADLNVTAQKVTVTATGDNTPLFRGVLGVGDSTFARSATAIWGPPASLVSSIPLTISQCEFDNAIPTPGALADPAALEAAVASGSIGTPPFPAGEVTFNFHSPIEIPGCPEGPPGSDHPGGFGWLEPDDDDDTTDCETSSDTSGMFSTSTGVSIPCDKDEFAALRGTVVPLPVYEYVKGKGDNAEYKMAGFAAFFLSGWRFPSFTGDSYATGSPPCSPPDTCISGWFTSATLADGGEVDFGAGGGGVNVVQLIG
ncbi:pilus assembly protein TadG-related protein [Quadrisphaera sp. GCM10027208]|uniref:pilus assembly protein TadG-related protein n=1 Tax=Quadrisphaera sp. GCM10027208 TaxID=3273423 RepID=UPI00361563A7